MSMKLRLKSIYIRFSASRYKAGNALYRPYIIFLLETKKFILELYEYRVCTTKIG